MEGSVLTLLLIFKLPKAAVGTGLFGRGCQFPVLLKSAPGGRSHAHKVPSSPTGPPTGLTPRTAFLQTLLLLAASRRFGESLEGVRKCLGSFALALLSLN